MKSKPVIEKQLIDCLLIVLAIFIPYHQVAQHTFVDFDDDMYIFLNAHVIQGLTWDSVVWAFTNTQSANWHPLTWISHLIDRELFGAHSGGYLLMNVAWHSLAACLAYFAFLKCTKSRIFALSVALIFALHPVNVENVAWASERKSILNAVFWFAAIISYLDFLSTKSRRSYGCAVICFILSLFSKAMSVTLPCTLVLIHCLYLVYHPDPRSPKDQLRPIWKQILGPTLPLLVLSLYFSLITLSAQSMAMPIDFSFSTRLINTILSYERYLVMFFHPTELAVYYPLNIDGPVDYKPIIPTLIVLLSLSGIVLLLVRKKPQLAIGWCWFLGTMIPVIGLVQVGVQSHADRYLYIPMLGLAFILPVLFETLSALEARIQKTIIGGALTVMSVAMGSATQIQVSYWQDGVTLSRHALSVTGFCFHSWVSLSRTCMRTERLDEYFVFLDSTLAVEQSPIVKGVLNTMKANALYAIGRYQPAAEAAQNSIALGYPTQASYGLTALSCYELGRIVDAEQYLAKAKAHPELDGGNIMLSFPLKPKLAWLESKLKERIRSSRQETLSMPSATLNSGSAP